jgi:hypothetical protein
MANNRIPALIERRPGGCSTAPGPGARHPHPPHLVQACTPVTLGAEVKDEQTQRFQLAVGLLEGHNRLWAQRAQSALMLVLGNIMLLVLVVLLSFLVLGGNPGWWPLLIAAGLTLAFILLSTLFALLAGASLQAGSGAPGAGLFFQSGPMPVLSAAQFSERFLTTTRQQMLEGALGELYAQIRRRERQERRFSWAMAAFGLAMLLFALMVVVVLVMVMW